MVGIPQRIVIVGGSVAGARTAQALRADGFDGELSVIEPQLGEAYDRPPLSKDYLTGEWSRERLNLIPGGWHVLAVDVVNAQAVGLDARAKTLSLSNATDIDYDALVIATGLSPHPLLADDSHPVGHVIATIEDADQLRERMQLGGHLVVVGGGYVAAEAASVARSFGLRTSLVHRGPHLLDRALGPVVGAHVTQLHRDRGVELHLNATVERIERADQGRARVRLTDGTILDADVLVAGIGARPNTEWLDGSGVRVDDGVLTDARLRVMGAPAAYALGDVARFYDVHSAKTRRVGHWTNAADQASVVAHNLLHPDEPRGYREAPYFWSDQFGQKIQVAGVPDSDAHVDLLTLPGATPRLAAVYSHGDDNDCGAVVTFAWPRGMVTARRVMALEPTSAEIIAELEGLASGVAVVGARTI